MIFVMITLILAILLFIFIMAMSPQLYNVTTYGVWSPPVMGPCESNNNSNGCISSGRQVVRYDCITNPNSHNGCLVQELIDSGELPSNVIQNIGNRGLTYDSVEYWQDCSSNCILSQWEASDNDSLCQVSTAIGCIPTGVIGERNVTLKCVEVDNIGANLCNTTTLANFTSNTPLITQGKMPAVQFYEIGDTINIKESCASNYDKPICGNWQVSWPLTLGERPLDEVELIENCQNSDQTNLFPVSTCDVINPNSNPMFNFWKEGVGTVALSCINNVVSIMPDNNDPNIELCSKITNNCTNTLPDPTLVITSGTYDSVMCSNNSKSNNPLCIFPCRYYDSDINVNSDALKALYNKFFLIYIIINNEIYYLSPQQSPNTSNLIVPFKDWGKHSTDPLKDVNITLTSINRNKNSSKCDISRTIYDTSMLFIAGIRSINSYTNSKANVSAQIVNMIDSGFLGWVDTLNYDLAVWTKAFNVANSTGITSLDAKEFNISISNYTRVEDVNPSEIPVPITPFTDSYANIQINLSDGSPLKVGFTEGAGVNNVQGYAIFFNQTETNTMCTRSTSTCNLHRNRENNATCDVNSIWSN